MMTVVEHYWAPRLNEYIVSYRFICYQNIVEANESIAYLQCPYF
jgi:hypothetical protein